ncbi:MAG: hypothetical protein ACPGU7_08555 [Gammaproteobacteria bacterium]
MSGKYKYSICGTGLGLGFLAGFITVPISPFLAGRLVDDHLWPAVAAHALFLWVLVLVFVCRRRADDAQGE